MARKRRKLNAENRFSSNRPSADEVLNMAVDDEEPEEREEEPVQQDASEQQGATVQPDAEGTMGTTSEQNEQEDAPSDDDKAQGFKKTSTGYVRADGTEMKRKTMFFTEAQWRKLQTKAIQAGHGTSTSAYVIDALDLDE